jgi:sulfur carrier protein ThiS
METAAGDSTLMGTVENGFVTVEMLPVKDDGSLLKVALTDGMILDDLIKSLNLPENTEAVIVNGVYVRPDYRLQNGDRVSVFPFMSGG